MSDPKKISFYNIREESEAGRLQALVGRSDEKKRLTRVLDRRMQNNVVVIGPNGIGKTALIHGWMHALSQLSMYDSEGLLQIDADHLYSLDVHPSLEERYTEAFSHLPSSVFFIDDFGREVYKNTDLLQCAYRLYKPLLKRPDVRVVLTLEPHEYAWIAREAPAFLHAFETLELKEQSSSDHARILSRTLPRLNRNRLIAPTSAMQEIVSFAERFPSLGQMPKSAIRILDESLAHAAAQGLKYLESDSIAHVVEAKTGVPKARLAAEELSSIKNLEAELNARVLDQDEAIAQIAKTLQRAKLGLRNPNRPLGSFLLLGPSGVGKTETAKSVAELLFGRQESFSRFDMSEFQQDHTVQRLIGAPAGYVGFEEGGALTNALKKEPHSLILLDEIEKAHPKVFDIFLQVLDEGRLTSGQNETVDARNAIVMATSNAAVAEILSATPEDLRDRERFLKEKVTPILAKTFRLEFINRFDAIVLFNPLSIQGLIKIAELEIRKIERRLSKHRVRFDIEPTEIASRIELLSDPRFGARPVKRFVEETCETLLADTLLASHA